MSELGRALDIHFLGENYLERMECLESGFDEYFDFCPLHTIECERCDLNDSRLQCVNQTRCTYNSRSESENDIEGSGDSLAVRNWR